MKIISEKKDKPFFKGGIGSFLIKFGNRALTFGLGVVLARALGTEAFGVYTFIYAIISLIGIPAQLGLPNLLIRYIPKYHIEKRWGNINGILRFTNIIVGVTSVFVMLLSFGLLYFEVIEFETAKYYTFLWGLALLPVIALGAIRGAVLRGFRMIIYGLLPETIVKPFLFINLVLMLFWAKDGNVTAADGMMLNFIASFLAYLLGAYWLIKYLPEAVKTSKPIFENKEWMHVALPLFLTGGVQIVMGRIDVILLGILINAKEVGIYEAAYKGGALVSFSMSALIPLLAPYFSRFYNSNQMEKLQKIASVSVFINTVFALLVTIIFIFYGELILKYLFGEDFVSGYWVLVIMSMLHLANVAFGTVVIFLNMTGSEKVVLAAMSIATVSNILLNLSLIPKFGIEGAAIASLLSTLFWNIWLSYICIKKYNINTTIISIIKLK